MTTPDRPNRVLWMTEELLELPSQYVEPAKENIEGFLESAGNPDMQHTIVDPEQCLELLKDRLSTINDTHPFTTAVDLTRGPMSRSLQEVLHDTPVWSDFSMGRIREATQLELPTSGHLISHNIQEIRATLEHCDTDHVLVLDDTSFSGTTSVVVENLIRQAFPERTVNFTHGFLIVNNGQLGPHPGAKQKLEAAGSGVVGGMEMDTPADDGWHFFDIVNQDRLPQHLMAVMGLIRALDRSGGDAEAREFMAHEANLRRLFPNMLTSETLTAEHKLGRFVSTRELNGGLHVRNPQLLPSIVGQGHLLRPSEWKKDEQQTLGYLHNLNQLMQDGAARA